MLADLLHAVPATLLEAPALMCGEAVVTYADIATRVGVLTERWRSLAGLRVGVAISNPVDHVASIATLDQLRCHVFLVGGRSDAEVRSLADQLHWNAIVWDLVDVPELLSPRSTAARVGFPDEGTVTLLTSGTTGRPKAATHTWRTLAGPVRQDARYTMARWMSAYPLSLYAGTQVMLQAFLNGSTLVIPPSLNPGVVARTMRTAQDRKSVV